MLEIPPGTSMKTPLCHQHYGCFLINGDLRHSEFGTRFFYTMQ
jgi:hypothetical protein